MFISFVIFIFLIFCLKIKYDDNINKLNSEIDRINTENLKYKSDLEQLQTDYNKKYLAESVYNQSIKTLSEKKTKLEKELKEYDRKIFYRHWEVVDLIGEDQFTLNEHNEQLKQTRSLIKNYIKNETIIKDCAAFNRKVDVENLKVMKKLTTLLIFLICENISLKEDDLDTVKNKILENLNSVNKTLPSGYIINERFIELKLEEVLLIKRRDDRKREKDFDDILDKSREHISNLQKDIEEKKSSIRKLRKVSNKLSGETKDKILEEIMRMEQKISESLGMIKKEEEVLKNKYAGWIYFVSNPMIPNQIKIGMSRRDDVFVRIAELSNSAGLPFKMDVLGVMPVDHVFEVENDFHNYFRKKIINTKKEWFHITPKEVQEALSKKGFDLVLDDAIVNTEYEKNKERLNKIGIQI